MPRFGSGCKGLSFNFFFFFNHSVLPPYFHENHANENEGATIPTPAPTQTNQQTSSIPKWPRSKPIFVEASPSGWLWAPSCTCGIRRHLSRSQVDTRVVGWFINISAVLLCEDEMRALDHKPAFGVQACPQWGLKWNMAFELKKGLGF